MEYRIEITETLSRVVLTKAASRREAIEKVREAYRREGVVLSADDFVDVEFKAV